MEESDTHSSPDEEAIFSNDSFTRLKCNIAAQLASAILSRDPIDGPVDGVQHDEIFTSALRRADWLIERARANQKSQIDAYRLFRPAERMTLQEMAATLKSANCPTLKVTQINEMLNDMAPVLTPGQWNPISKTIKPFIEKNNIECSLYCYIFIESGKEIACYEFEEHGAYQSTKKLVRPFELLLCAKILQLKECLPDKYAAGLTFECAYDKVISPPRDYHLAVSNTSTEGIAVRSVFPEFYQSAQMDWFKFNNPELDS